MKPSPADRTGFTLIELSIVLVIIGLIVGGILVGRDMVRSAELRSIITDVERYKTAVQTFRTKYSCLVGDCPNATDFFGVDPNGCPDAAYTPAAGTCNGDNDGFIYWNSIGGDMEALRAWQQLGLAGLVNGTFPGTDVDANAKPGINIPASRISGVGYSLGYFNYAGNTNFPGWATAGSAPPGNRIDVGMRSATPGTMAIVPFTTPYEAWGMDVKIDDGRPITGTFTVAPGSGCASIGASADDPATNYYNWASSVGNKVTCALVFLLGQ